MSLQYLSGVGDLGRVRRKRKKIKLFKRRRKKVEEQAPEQAPEQQAPEQQAPEQQAPEQEESLNDLRVKKLRVKRRIKKQNEEQEQEPEQEPEPEQEQEQQPNEENMSNDSEGMGLIYPGVPTPLNFLRNRRLKRFPRKHRRRVVHATAQNLVKPKRKYRILRHAQAHSYKTTGLPLHRSVIHPQLQQIGRTKGRLKARLKAKFKKIIDRRKNDKHSRKDKIAHFFAKQALFIPRGAFLGILLLGKALQKTPIKINLAKKIKQNWASKGNQIKEIWYKLGGEPDILIKQVEKANNAKLSGDLGFVATAGIGAAIASATPVILKIMKLFGKAKEFADKNPKLVALGQGILKKGIEKVSKKNGKLAQNYSEAIKLADDITSVLPPETQAKISKIRKKLPNTLINQTGNKAVEQVKEVTKQVDSENPNLENQSIKETIKDSTTSDSVTPKSNTMLYVGLGATALVGAYLLTKKR